MFVKLGENSDIVVHGGDSSSDVDLDIKEKFAKVAKDLKIIAPKADDFLYFSAVMMHAAEASLLNSDGTPKKNYNGELVTANWEINGESWRWKCSDTQLKPYKNSNGDIFPENELLKAHKNWIGKPLCIDHKSNSVDHVRGIIVDTYYDRVNKRVIALCALDKVNYPDLARKVSTGTSNSVSMGVGVSTAVCFDCGKAAKVERDFCDHMKYKTTYGEVNIGLNPIELSIVVNGADPQAKIKHIVAAANYLNDYIEKHAENYSPVLTDIFGNIKEELGKLKKSTSITDLENQIGKVESLIDLAEEELKKASESQSNKEHLSEDQETKILKELEDVKTAANDKLSHSGLDHIAESLEKIASLLKTNNGRNSTMNLNKKSYYMGAGGINEPAPKSKKYPVEPQNEELRLEGDKHMLTHDTGKVDELFPGDEDKKKNIHRASLEDRAMRRSAVLKKAKENLMNYKNAYLNGGGGVNDPANLPYPKDKLNEEARDEEDKQMVGQSPFPGVGDVKGLHPSPASVKEKDELKRKQMLARASLKARFVKAASTTGDDDLGNSAWHVYAGDRLILTASVNELSGNRPDFMYDSIATQDFGKKLLEKVRSLGVTKTASLLKQGQAATPETTAPAAPAASAPAATPAPAVSAPVPASASSGEPATPAAPVADEGGTGDVKEKALSAAEKLRDMAAEMLETVRALVGEKSEMGELEQAFAGEPKTANAKTLFRMRRELNENLTEEAKKCYADLRKHEKEMKIIASAVDEIDQDNEDYLEIYAEEAFEDSKIAMKKTYEFMNSFVTYAKATQTLVKKAESEINLRKNAEDNEMDELEKLLENYDTASAKDKSKKHVSSSDKKAKKHVSSSDEEKHVSSSDEDEKEHKKHVSSSDEDEALDSDTLSVSDSDHADDEMSDDDLLAALDELTGGDDHDDDDTDLGLVSSSDEHHDSDPMVTTAQTRAAYRAKVAKEAKEQFSPMLEVAHPGGGTVTKMDVKPSLENAYRVETLEEMHEAAMEVAMQKVPENVRLAAQEIDSLVKAGKLSTSEVDELVSHGVDAAAVKYWKEYYKEAENDPESQEFAAELVAEKAKKEAEEQAKVYRVKLARAYDLANDMIRRGLLADNSQAVNAQVEEIMTWNDEGFESMKRVIARKPDLGITKRAQHIPNVGFIGSGDPLESSESPNLVDELTRAFANRRY